MRTTCNDCWNISEGIVRLVSFCFPEKCNPTVVWEEASTHVRAKDLNRQALFREAQESTSAIVKLAVLRQATGANYVSIVDRMSDFRNNILASHPRSCILAFHVTVLAFLHCMIIWLFAATVHSKRSRPDSIFVPQYIRPLRTARSEYHLREIPGCVGFYSRKRSKTDHPRTFLDQREGQTI